jgi:hypothetical protein
MSLRISCLFRVVFSPGRLDPQNVPQNGHLPVDTASYVTILATMIPKSRKLRMAYDSSVDQAAADYDQLRFLMSCPDH